MLGVRKKKAVKKRPPANAGVSISDSQFYGVKYDAELCGTVSKIAEGLLENARGLTALARFLRAEHIVVESMVRIGGDHVGNED